MKKIFLSMLVFLAVQASQAGPTLAPEIASLRKGACYQSILESLALAVSEQLLDPDATLVTDLNIIRHNKFDHVATARTVTQISDGTMEVAHWFTPLFTYSYGDKTCTTGPTSIAIEDDALSGGGGVSVHN